VGVPRCDEPRRFPRHRLPPPPCRPERRRPPNLAPHHGPKLGDHVAAHGGPSLEGEGQEFIRGDALGHIDVLEGREGRSHRRDGFVRYAVARRAQGGGVLRKMTVLPFSRTINRENHPFSEPQRAQPNLARQRSVEEPSHGPNTKQNPLVGEQSWLVGKM
jgi:hypothetical protein